MYHFSQFNRNKKRTKNWSLKDTTSHWRNTPESSSNIIKYLLFTTRYNQLNKLVKCSHFDNTNELYWYFSWLRDNTGFKLLKISSGILTWFWKTITKTNQKYIYYLITAGPSAAAPLFRKYCGSAKPPVFRSKTNYASVRMKTNQRDTSGGFVILYR